MKRLVLLFLASTFATAGTAAGTDRDLVVRNLAGFYYSADVCQLAISRAKVEAYAEKSRGADDRLFNVDVFRATQALYAEQKDWTKEQTAAWCEQAAKNAKTLDVSL